MQSTGQTSTQDGQPEHSSGMITTSMPLSKMAPNSAGQLRTQVSQVMHSDASMRRGGFFQLSPRDRAWMRSSRAATAAGVTSRAEGIPNTPQSSGKGRSRRPKDRTRGLAGQPFDNSEGDLFNRGTAAVERVPGIV